MTIPVSIQRVRPVSAVVTVVLAGMALGCDSPPKEEAAPPPRVVKVAPVETGDVIEQVDLVGELEGAQEVRVSALVSERILAIAVREGDVVKKGALLATLHGDLLAEAERQAQAGLEAALANRDAAQDSLRRIRSLVEGGSAPPAQLESAQTQFRAAEAQVRQLTAGLNQAAAQRSRGRVLSPIDGTVAGIHLREGDLASPGAPVMTVVRTDRLKAVLRVPERNFLRVEEGMKVRVSPLARPDVKVEGVVTVKGSTVDRLTRTGLVEVDLDNSDSRLVAGSAIRAVIEIGRRAEAMLAPAAALLFTTETERTGRAVSFVVENGIARRRDVRIGSRQGESLEILEGLSPGDPLVVEGAHLLRDGVSVKVVEPLVEDAS